MLEQKETKIQGNSPTSICPPEASQNGGSHRIAKASRTITNVCRNVKKIEGYSSSLNLRGGNLTFRFLVFLVGIGKIKPYGIARKYGGWGAKNASRQSGELRIQGFSEAQRKRKIRRIPRGELSIFLACLFWLLFLTKKKSNKESKF